MKTLKECKDEVANKYMLVRGAVWLNGWQLDEAAELYAQQYKDQIKELESEIEVLRQFDER